MNYEFELKEYKRRISPQKIKQKSTPKKILRRVIVSLTILAVVFSLMLMQDVAIAIASTNQNIIEELERNVNDSLNNIDFGELDDILAGIGSGFNLFGEDSFMQRVSRIISGEFQTEHNNMFSALFALFGSAIFGFLPIIMLIVGVAIFSGLMQALRHHNSGEGVRNIIHFVTYSAIVVIVMYGVASMIATVTGTLNSIRTQMDIIFPILLTLMVASGGQASSSVYQPAVVILSNGVMQIFTLIVMPLFIITLIFSIVGNLSNTNRFDKFVSFFTSAYKWILGLTFTIFLSFLAIQGITASAHDGISIRAARFTISSYVPFLGGYLSQGFDLVLASSILIKNAVGLAGLYLLLGVVLAPIIQIAVFSLGLKLAAAITQPIADERISNFLSTVNKAFSMLAAILIGVAFMYFLTIGLIIMTGNVL
ncbi:MAG: stage III sporulation protein AE [Firmicutes bacterium]|nr:stage III sporulation protein AE [Bacillota bacterium]